MINAGDHIDIIPLPDDPFKALDGSFTINKTFKELRQQAEKLMLREIGVMNADGK